VPVDDVRTRLQVYLAEDDRSGHRSLGEDLLAQAHDRGMAGATLWRGIEGFGASGGMRTARFPDAGAALPLVLEVVDTDERVQAFLDAVVQRLPAALVTTEPVRVRRG
jgi:PII-like signaling protein